MNRKNGVKFVIIERYSSKPFFFFWYILIFNIIFNLSLKKKKNCNTTKPPSAITKSLEAEVK